jgi:hypothetical protein
MTHDERIEAMARVIDWFVDADLSREEWAQVAEAALAAAGVEEMVREAADKGYEEGFQCLEYDMQAESDAVEAIVREVMGK